MKFVYRIGYTFFKVSARILWRYRVIHPERLEGGGGCMVVANHASFLDPPMVGVAFPDAIYYLARKTLFSNPVISWVYQHWNTVPVDQQRPELSTMKRIISLLRDGERVLVFPEGQRCEDGHLQEGKAGVGLLAAKAKARVLPVRIFGAYQALPRGASFIRRSRITVVVGEAFETRPYLEDPALKGKAVYQAIADRMMEEIGKLSLPEGEANPDVAEAETAAEAKAD